MDAGSNDPNVISFERAALLRAVFYSAAADCADRWCAQQETGPEDAG
jgi:hypothetical protein